MSLYVTGTEWQTCGKVKSLSLYVTGTEWQTCGKVKSMSLYATGTEWQTCGKVKSVNGISNDTNKQTNINLNKFAFSHIFWMQASWPWTYGSEFTTTYAISAYHPLMLWVRISTRARCTTLCDKVCYWLATDRWFSPGFPLSSTNKTDSHDITEILLKDALNTIKQTNGMHFISPSQHQRPTLLSQYQQRSVDTPNTHTHTHKYIYMYINIYI
jgi:hypothetical protein